MRPSRWLVCCLNCGCPIGFPRPPKRGTHSPSFMSSLFSHSPSRFFGCKAVWIKSFYPAQAYVCVFCLGGYGWERVGGRRNTDQAKRGSPTLCVFPFWLFCEATPSKRSKNWRQASKTCALSIVFRPTHFVLAHVSRIQWCCFSCDQF